jgi:hypothetical protein
MKHTLSLHISLFFDVRRVYFTRINVSRFPYVQHLHAKSLSLRVLKEQTFLECEKEREREVGTDSPTEKKKLESGKHGASDDSGDDG